MVLKKVIIKTGEAEKGTVIPAARRSGEVRESKDTKRRSSSSNRPSIAARLIQEIEDVPSKSVLEISHLRFLKSRRHDIVLCMIPHNEFWITVIVVVISVHVQFTMFKLMYLSDSEESWCSYLHYTFEVFYLADSVFTALHRNLSHHKIDFCTKKLPYILVIISWLTLIPYYEIYVYFLDGAHDIVVENCFKLKVLLRLFQVFYYFHSKCSDSSSRAIFDIFMECVYRYSACVLCGACVWTAFGCYKCDYPNWTNNLKDFMYDDNSTVDRFFYPYTFVASVFMENYAGLIKAETWYEYGLLSVILLCGVLLKTVVACSRLIVAFICNQQKQHLFDSRLTNTFDYIEMQNIDKHLKDDIEQFYNTFWLKRSAIGTMPSYFNLLPMSLKKDVMVDIFWDAFKHSHLFRNIGKTFKRDLSLIMKSEFLLAGDYLYKTGETKYKMYYVVLGVVQILSNEDDESPVISFSSGTVLSEMACLTPCRSDCMVRCASFCEFQTLSVQDLCRKLAFYRQNSWEFHAALDDRIQLARILCDRKRENLIKNEMDRPFIRIKTQWRAIYANKMPKNISNYHTNRFLDLYVLSDDMELKVQVICLTATFPFILHPNSSFRTFCDYVCLVSVIVQCIVVPYCASFERTISDSLFTFCLFLDALYVFDIGLQVTTAIKDKDKMITNFGGILMKRLREYSFQADIIATLPLDYCGYLKGVSDHTLILLKIPRIIKIYKLVVHMQNYEHILGRDQMFSKFLKYLVIYMIIVYFGICLYYSAACFTETCDKYSWFAYNIDNFIDMADVNPFSRTAFSVNALVVGAADANNYPYSMMDTSVAHLLNLAGFVMMLLAINDLTAACYWRSHDRLTHRILTKSMQTFGKVHKIADRLMIRVVNMLNFRWDYNRDLIKWDAMRIFDDTPPNLRKRIRYSLITHYLKKQPLFQHLDEIVIKHIANISRVIAVPPGACLSFSDRITSHIYVLKRGYCVYESDVPGDRDKKTHRKVISAGDSFPVIEVMHEVCCFVSVQALTTVEFISIPYNQMMVYLKMDLRGYEILQSCLKIHMKENYSVLTRAEHRMNLRVERKGTIENAIFSYSTSSQRVQDAFQGKTVFDCCRATSSPRGKFCIIMEIIRCILALTQFIFIIMYINILFAYKETVDILNYLLDFTVWIDCFIRTRIHYYDESGRLETGIKNITKHYFRTSFWIDIYSAFPVYIVSIGHLMNEQSHFLVNFVLYLVTRPFQLFRVYFGIAYVLNSYKFTDTNVVRIKCLLLVLVVILVLSNFFMVFICDINEERVVCPLNPNIDFFSKSNPTPHALSLYLHTTCLYFTSFENVIETQHTDTAYWAFASTSLFLVLFAWFIVSRLNSAGLSSEYMNIQVQNDIRSFKAFTEKETVEKNLVSSILQTHGYLIRDMVSYALEQARARFTVQLASDFSYSLYSNALGKTYLLDQAPESLRRFISSQLRSEFIKKDGIIIRNNDVQEDLYVIRQGVVSIMIVDTEVALLTEGAMFGCFSKYGYVRQTIHAEAALHTVLLAMPSKMWHYGISKHPAIVKLMNRLVISNTEYIKSNVKVDDSFRKSLDVQTSGYQTKKMYTNTINRIINQNTKAFYLFNYFMNVHLSMISCMVILIYQLISMYEEQENNLKIAMYFFDAFFLIKIFFGFNLSYIDEKSGVVILDQKMIIKRYLRTTFTLDLISVLAPELLAKFFRMKQFHKSLFCSNRLLRIFFLINFYHYHKAQNQITHTMRSIYNVYIFLFCIQGLTNLWSMVACHPFNGCYASRSLEHGSRSHTKSNRTITSIMMCYQHVFNRIIGSSLLAIRPRDLDDMWTDILMALVAPYLMAMLTSGFALIRIIDNHSLAIFNYNIAELKTYLRYQSLSPAIFIKVSHYCEVIWKVQSGEPFPALLENTVQYLKEDIMFDIYGHHLLNHPVFKNTHKDFLRQLMVHFKRCTYPSDYVIVEKGDIDKTMYFIHSGAVDCVEKGESGDVVLFTLKKNEVFGLEQGLIGNVHNKTFVVKAYVDILMLQKGDWEYLLRFFPASVEEILNKAREFNLFNADKL